MNAEIERKLSLRSLFIFGVLCVALSLAPAVYAQAPGDELEKEAQTIDRMIMCPVCPAETIDQAQVEISFQMRAVIREMLAEGRNRDEILDYFVDRYGPDILAAPPKSGRNLLAWILPIVGVAIGLVGVFFVIRAMTNRRSAPSQASGNRESEEPPVPQPTDPELAPYLEIVDQMLATRRRTRPAFSAAAPSEATPNESGESPSHDSPAGQEGVSNG